MSSTKVVVVGAGPVGSLAALYAAQRGYDVEIYELRNGKTLPETNTSYYAAVSIMHFSFHEYAHVETVCFFCLESLD